MSQWESKWINIQNLRIHTTFLEISELQEVKYAHNHTREGALKKLYLKHDFSTAFYSKKYNNYMILK